MKVFLNVCIVCLLTISTYAKTGTIKVSGVITNHAGSELTITDFDYQNLSKASIDKQGVFKMKAKIESGYYLLNYGRESLYIYLYPGDQLKVTFDGLLFESTLLFEGIGAARNNYLIKKSIKDAELTNDVEAFYKVAEAKYLNNIENVQAIHKASLENLEVEDFFTADEKKSLEYDKLLSIQNYASFYEFYLGDEIVPTAGFYKPLENLDLNREEDYKKLPMYRYLVNSIWSDRISDGKNVDEMLNVLRTVKSKPVLISLVNGFYSKISSEKERGEDYFKLIKRIAGNNKGFVDAARKKLKETKDAMELVAGTLSPSFNYVSITGEHISLADFKGEYVYIDVWATWCGPCIKQIPYLKELEHRYEDTNITFVSISVDKENVKDKWRQMVAAKELGGTQLFADNSFDSSFMKAYGINSIPRFIIIDPEGKVLEATAPRPSYEKTKTLLDSLVK